MFCPNCGTDLPESAVFCGNCGATLNAAPPKPQPQPIPAQAPPTQPQFAQPQPVAQPQQGGFAQPYAQQPYPQQPPVQKTSVGDSLKGAAAQGTKAIAPLLAKFKGGDSKKLLTLAGAALAALIVLIVAISAIAGTGAKGTAKKYLKASLTGNISKAIKYEYADAKAIFKEGMNDDDISVDIEDDYNTKSYSKFITALEKEDKEETQDYLGKHVKVKDFEIRSVKEAKTSEMKAIREYLEVTEGDEFLQFKPSKITKVVTVKYHAKMEGKDDSVTVNPTILLVKASGKWYVLNSSLSGTSLYSLVPSVPSTTSLDGWESALSYFLD
ncbi:MAG: zinc ribbon domain-containing protein [Oscillospiraceae bacterium]|jgi:hypothetical protein|nr:zinc ribbon domain-containing protein [Oscillospiraceae bacterium]